MSRFISPLAPSDSEATHCRYVCLDGDVDVNSLKRFVIDIARQVKSAVIYIEVFESEKYVEFEMSKNRVINDVILLRVQLGYGRHGHKLVYMADKATKDKWPAQKAQGRFYKYVYVQEKKR